jgi:hypothetical protein
LFEQSLGAECVYFDPLTQATGYEQLSGYISELHKNIPGVRFIITNYKNHHGRSVTHWNMMDVNGNVVSQGANYGLYGVDDRLVQMTGLFEN